MCLDSHLPQFFFHSHADQHRTTTTTTVQLYTAVFRALHVPQHKCGSSGFRDAWQHLRTSRTVALAISLSHQLGEESVLVLMDFRLGLCGYFVSVNNDEHTICGLRWYRVTEARSSDLLR